MGSAPGREARRARRGIPESRDVDGRTEGSSSSETVSFKCEVGHLVTGTQEGHHSEGGQTENRRANDRIQTSVVAKVMEPKNFFVFWVNSFPLFV